MTRRLKIRWKLTVEAGMFVIGVLIVATPTGRNVAVSAVTEFAVITERFACCRYWFVDHARRLSLDRFDPTCPQCI
jgi:hypothetical protein